MLTVADAALFSKGHTSYTSDDVAYRAGRSSCEARCGKLPHDCQTKLKYMARYKCL